MELDFQAHTRDIRTYSAGQVIFSEGDVGDALFVLLEGEVAISLQGRELDRLTPRSIFGEMALIEDRPRSASAIAVSECQLLRVGRAQFANLVRLAPEFALRVMTVMSDRLRHLMDEELERLRMEEELKIGQQIQLSLLPEKCPPFPGWEFAAAYQAAREVGGDFYDFIQVPEDPRRLHLVIADVTGKGVPASLFMASSRMALRAEASIGLGPAETLRRTNRLISLDVCSPLLLSAFYATLDTATGRLSFANAGHEWPVWLHEATGQIDYLQARGLLLRAFADVEYEEQEIVVAPGDTLVLFTDGVTEARDATGELFGDERLQQIIAARDWQSADELLQVIVSSVEAFRGLTPPSDDLTLVVIRRL